MHNAISKSGQKKRAFTLVEISVATAIMGFAVMGAASITIQGLKVYYADSNRLTVNKDMRKFTQYMFTDAAFANEFFIFDPDTNGPIPTTGGTTNGCVSTGQSGDDLLLVTTQTDSASGATTITQLIAYYRTVTNTANNSGPVYRIEVSNLSVAGSTPIYTLWHSYIEPAASSQTATFMTSVIGTAGYNPSVTSQAHLNLFYNSGSFVMVRAKIQEQGYEGGSQANTNQVDAIDTYNLSIWPRG